MVVAVVVVVVVGFLTVLARNSMKKNKKINGLLNKGVQKQRKNDGWLENSLNKTRENRRWLLVRSHVGPSHLRHRRGAAAPQEKKQTV